MDDIHRFAKIHQYDNKDTYKEAWTEWLDSNEDAIMRESDRLRSIGYEGDVLHKMYKSGRYYFRTKSTDRVDPRKRREYVPMAQEIIQTMDDHIRMHYGSPDYTPALGYDDFCKTEQVALLREVTALRDRGFTDPKDIASKIKKTYKNRYFQFIKAK